MTWGDVWRKSGVVLGTVGAFALAIRDVWRDNPNGLGLAAIIGGTVTCLRVVGAVWRDRV